MKFKRTEEIEIRVSVDELTNSCRHDLCEFMNDDDIRFRFSANGLAILVSPANAAGVAMALLERWAETNEKRSYGLHRTVASKYVSRYAVELFDEDGDSLDGLADTLAVAACRALLKVSAKG